MSHKKFSQWRLPLSGLLMLAVSLCLGGLLWSVVFPEDARRLGQYLFGAGDVAFAVFTFAAMVVGVLVAVLLSFALYNALMLRFSTRLTLVLLEQLQLLLHQAPAAVAVFDKQMRYVAASDRWNENAHMQGMNPIGKRPYDIFPELFEQNPLWRQLHDRALQGESFPLREDRWTRPDGKEEWTQWAIHPCRNARGKVVGIVMFAETITARKESELALRNSEEILRHAMDQSPIGMAMVAPSGKWLQVNEALVKMLGYTAEELLSMDFQQVTHPDDLQLDIGNLKRLLNGEMRQYRTEKRYICKNGEHIWIALHVSLVRDEKDEPLYFISQIINISDQKEVDDAKERLIQHLAETNTALERFAFIASHDLREPARLVCSYAELLKQEYADQLDSMGQKYIGICTRAAHRMVDLISDLLAYVQVGKGQVPRERFDVDSVLNYVKDMLTETIYSKEAEIFNGELPELQTNKTAFTLLLQNLIGNALKYSREGVPPRIHIDARRQEEQWLFSVRDNGIGMKPEFHAQVFEPFKRLHDADEYEGTGMGLAICQKIVKQLGGEIWVESIPGQGSVFFFTVNGQA